jgi:hypothetical protein
MRFASAELYFVPFISKGLARYGDGYILHVPWTGIVCMTSASGAVTCVMHTAN